MEKTKKHLTGLQRRVLRRSKVHYIKAGTGNAVSHLPANRDEWLSDISSHIEKILRQSDSSLAIGSLLRKTELPASLLAELFEMTAKTLAKYKNEKLKLPTRHAELAVKLDMLYSLGSEIFGSTKEFNEWLKEKSYGLNDEKPIGMLNTVTGIDLVTEELRRIEFGATA